MPFTSEAYDTGGALWVTLENSTVSRTPSAGSAGLEPDEKSTAGPR